MALESCPLEFETVGGEIRPKLPPLPEGFYMAARWFEDHPDIQHPADEEHPEPWSEPDPRPKLAWYDYQPIPAPPTITMADREAEQATLLADGRARLGEAADQDEDTVPLAAYCKAIRSALAGITDPSKVVWPAKPWESISPAPTPTEGPSNANPTV
jgi:hypothetical protein